MSIDEMGLTRKRTKPAAAPTPVEPKQPRLMTTDDIENLRIEAEKTGAVDRGKPNRF